MNVNDILEQRNRCTIGLKDEQTAGNAADYTDRID